MKAVDDYYNNASITITGGTGEGQTRIISDYTGSSKVAGVSIIGITPLSLIQPTL